MDKQLIEVEIRDWDGKICFEEKNDSLNQQLIDVVENRLQESIGGLLCQVHFQLPCLSPEYSNNRWIVKVCCCCASNMELVETRITQAFYRKADKKNSDQV